MSSAAGGNLPLVPELVEQAEIRVKSALAAAGAPMIQGWLRSGIMAEIDPTGLYFLRQPRPIRAREAGLAPTAWQQLKMSG